MSKLKQKLSEIESWKLGNISNKVESDCITKAKTTLAKQRLVKVVYDSLLEEMRRLYFPQHNPYKKVEIKKSFWTKVKEAYDSQH